MAFRSDRPDIAPLELPIHDAVLATAERHAEIPALVDGVTGESVSYAQLDTGSRRVAAGLAEAGVRKGDVVALYSPNTIAYPVALYAATRAGATVTTVSSLATVKELTGQLRDSRARWIVTVSPFLAAAAEAAGVLAQEGQPIQEIFVCDRAEGHRSLTDLLASTAPEPQPRIDPATDIAVLPYSSGTTGLPKGVMLSHRSVSSNLFQTESMRRTEPGERILAVLPFFHYYGSEGRVCRP